MLTQILLPKLQPGWANANTAALYFREHGFPATAENLADTIGR